MKIRMLAVLPLCALLISSCGSNAGEQEPRRVEVKIVKAADAGNVDAVVYSGTIEAGSATALSFSSAGTIESMAITEGQMVSKGAVLAALDGATQASLLSSARAATVIAVESLTQMEDTYARMESLHSAGSLSETQWIEVETRLAQAKAAVDAARAQEAIAEKGVADVCLRAPFTGYVSEKMADVGGQAAPGVPIVKLYDIDRVKAKFSVGENETGRFRTGDTLRVRIAALQGAVFTGCVRDKGVNADPISRSYEIGVEIENKDHRILPGMLCEVYGGAVADGGGAAAPSQAIMTDYTNRHYVWILADSIAKKRYVSIGGTYGGMTIINEGVSAGDSVITDGRGKVWDGATCTVRQ